MPRKSNVIHFKAEFHRLACGYRITHGSNKRFKGRRSKALTSNKNRVTCKNCLRVLNASKPKVHCLSLHSSEFKLWHNYITLCGINIHFLQVASKSFCFDKSTFKNITCKNCKRILNKCKRSKKK